MYCAQDPQLKYLNQMAHMASSTQGTVRSMMDYAEDSANTCEELTGKMKLQGELGLYELEQAGEATVRLPRSTL